MYINKCILFVSICQYTYTIVYLCMTYQDNYYLSLSYRNLSRQVTNTAIFQGVKTGHNLCFIGFQLGKTTDSFNWLYISLVRLLNVI